MLLSLWMGPRVRGGGDGSLVSAYWFRGIMVGLLAFGEERYTGLLLFCLWSVAAFVGIFEAILSSITDILRCMRDWV